MSEDAGKLTDLEVVEICLNGDINIFSEIVCRYKNLVYSVILRMINDTEEANDLSQEVFIKIYKNLDKYHPEFKLSTWIMRITTNHVIDYRRKIKKEIVSLNDIAEEISWEKTPENIMLKNEKIYNLRHVVEELPDMYKIPIVLYHQEGFSYQEIADITKQPLSKVKNRLFRGRKILKESLLKETHIGVYGGMRYEL